MNLCVHPRLASVLACLGLTIPPLLANAAAWHPRTTDWSTNPAPSIGDWGFDRPGFAQGLYLHGVTVPDGHFPAKPLPNPIIYDNDEYADVLDDDVLCAMASLGKLTLAAQIITPIDPKGVFKQSWQDSAFWHYDRCSRSGMCLERIPKPVIGNTGSEPDPDSPGARAYVDLILARHAAQPDRPLLIALGGQSATLASAYLRNPAIADKVIVFYVSANAYNGQLAWASEVVCQNMRVVHAFHYWWPEAGLPNQLQALPRNNSEDWNDISGEWAVLDNLKHVLGRGSLPFMDDPYRNKFNCGGFLERLKRNHQYNSGHHHKGWGDDAYSDGNIFVAWQPAMYREGVLRNVRGGQVIDHEYHLDWLDPHAIHAASYPFLSDPDAYRDCANRPAHAEAANGDAIQHLPDSVPTGITIHWDTLQRKGCRGDNWCMTWAADDNIYTMMDDGGGFHAYKPEWGTRLWRIPGNENFTAEQAVPVPGWPFTDMSSPFYGYGTYSVQGRIYTWLWKSETDKGYRRPVANRLLYTDDFGETFFRWNGTAVTEADFSDTHEDSFFFYKEDPRPKAGREAYAFNWIAFCQNGKDNSAAKNDYVYMYSVEQYDVTKLSMIRVPKNKVTDRSAYEYLQEVVGERAVWTSDMTQRGPTITYPAKNYNGDDWLWSSWHPDVVFNPGLNRYIMVSYGISDGTKDFFSGWCANCKHSATVGMWHAKHPWGPWTRFYYQTEWKTPGDPPDEWGFSGAASRTYQFKLNPKWIYDNGRTMYLIWSDAGGLWTGGKHGHSDYWYKWNQVRITLDLGSPVAGDAPR